MSNLPPPQKPTGDPEGRRLARHRALLLAEASRVVRQLEVLLKRADFDFAPCTRIIDEVAHQEKIELMRSHGRIESRKKYKLHTSHPLLENRPRNILHIDESGQSIPERNVVSPLPSAFALSGIALAEEKVDDYIVAADEIKQEFFGRTDITFHEPQMRHREGWFGLGGDSLKQEEFDSAINELIAGTPFVAFGVGVRKDAFKKEFVDSGVDPYLVSDIYSVAILMLLERYIDFLAAQTTKRLGRVIFESQGTVENAMHQLEYARILLDGSQWVPDSAFRCWLETGLRFQPKCGSDPMEISDMFARDLFEWVRSDCTITPHRWELFGDKIYCRGDGAMGKFGVKVFPDSDIRDRIERHRMRCGAAR